MTIYELIKDGETSEIKALGHHSPTEFASRIKEETGIDVNIGDVKQCYERMEVKRNVISYRRCSWYDFGANPVTLISIKDKYGTDKKNR